MRSEKLMASWRWLSIGALATIAGIWGPAVANAAGTDAEAGKQIFQEKCVACHTIGKGPLVGPDLKGVTAVLPREWLEHWIAAPDVMLAKKDPVATELLHQFHDVPMVNMGLSTSDVTAILAFLETAETQPSAPAAATAPAVQGNPEIGKELFTGVARFANGGAPGSALHKVEGIGGLGRGAHWARLTRTRRRPRGGGGRDRPQP